MTAAALLADLRRGGVELTVDGDRLRYGFSDGDRATQAVPPASSAAAREPNLDGVCHESAEAARADAEHGDRRVLAGQRGNGSDR